MLYEVPYNFDENLIHFFKSNKSHISYLYIPPYRDDSDNTRTTIQTTVLGHCYFPYSREEYEYHLRKVNSSGLKYVILWQVHNKPLTDYLIKYYCGLGASGFIVANDINASAIKQYNPNLMTICSIVQRVSCNIIDKNLSKYDYVILYYPFNRALNALKKLTKFRNKIILMPNTLCNVDCPSTHHWFPSANKPFDPKKDCPMTEKSIGKCGLIFPRDLFLFDDYVSGYKLQGREYTTETIKYICNYYFKRKKGLEFVDPFLKTSMAKELKKLADSTTPEEYYNMKSLELTANMIIQ